MIHFYVLVFLVTCQAYSLPSNCTKNTNNGMNCTIETGGAVVQCPEENVIRVIGDYQNFSIHCAYDGTMIFTYDGTKPTEAIRVNSWRDVAFDNQSYENLKIIRQHMKVEVISVLNLIEEYKKTFNLQSSDLPISRAIYYSRTGGFHFFASNGFEWFTVKFVIFFEEPGVEPAFINRYDQNEGWKVPGQQKYFVECRTTFYVQPDEWGEPELWVNGEKPMQDKVLYDPTAGFNVSSSLRDIMSFMSSNPIMRCVIPHKTNPSKNITFDPNSKTAVNELALKNETETPIWSYFSKDEKFNAQCTPNESTLNFIGARNPDEQVLVRDFVLPEFVNRSLHLEKGKLSEEQRTFTPRVQTHRGISLHFGALYCAGERESNLRSFVTDIKGQSSFLGLSHSIDWRHIQNLDRDTSWPEDKLPSKANPELYLELTTTFAGRIIYDFDNVTFHCRIHPFFLRPVVWQIEQNETVTRQVEEDVTADYSIMSTQLKPGFASISCLASLWAWYHRWRDLTVNVTVLASENPKFEQHQQLNYTFAPDAVNPQQATVKKISEEMTSHTEAKFRINCLRATKLNCEAKNGRGVDNITIDIHIKSSGCNDGVQTVYDMYGLSFIGAGLWLTINIFEMF